MTKRDRAHGWPLALLLLPLGACYTGRDSAPQSRADGGADDGADDGETPPRVPGDEEPDAPFQVPTDEARLLPFSVRMANLAHVVGQDLEHPMFLPLYELRYQLGDHHFASGVAADLRWSADKMQSWVKGLKPVCSSAEMQQAYPDLLTDPRPLMRAAWGHEPAAEEVQALLDLQGETVPAEQRYAMTCTAVLTALDFVAI